MPRQANPLNANRKQLNVSVAGGLFDSVSELVSITGTTWVKFVSTALRNELNSSLDKGGTDLKMAMKVSKTYRSDVA